MQGTCLSFLIFYWAGAGSIGISTKTQTETKLKKKKKKPGVFGPFRWGHSKWARHLNQWAELSHLVLTLYFRIWCSLSPSVCSFRIPLLVVLGGQTWQSSQNERFVFSVAVSKNRTSSLAITKQNLIKPRNLGFVYSGVRHGFIAVVQRRVPRRRSRRRRRRYRAAYLFISKRSSGIISLHQSFWFQVMIDHGSWWSRRVFFFFKKKPFCDLNILSSCFVRADEDIW